MAASSRAEHLNPFAFLMGLAKIDKRRSGRWDSAQTLGLIGMGVGLDADGLLWVSIRDVANAVGVSPGTAYEHLRELEQAGLVTGFRHRRDLDAKGTGQWPTRWRLNPVSAWRVKWRTGADVGAFEKWVMANKLTSFHGEPAHCASDSARLSTSRAVVRSARDTQPRAKRGSDRNTEPRDADEVARGALNRAQKALDGGISLATDGATPVRGSHSLDLESSKGTKSSVDEAQVRAALRIAAVMAERGRHVYQGSALEHRLQVAMARLSIEDAIEIIAEVEMYRPSFGAPLMVQHLAMCAHDPAARNSIVPAASPGAPPAPRVVPGEVHLWVNRVTLTPDDFTYDQALDELPAELHEIFNSLLSDQPYRPNLEV